jgi:hypothetical protein
MKTADAIPGVSIVTAPYRAAMVGNKFLADVAQGKNISESVKASTHELTDVMKEQVKSIRTAAPFLSYVPGIGQGVALALTTASGVALGEPISQAVLDGVSASLPGAPASQLAFNAAVQATQAIAEGKPLSEAALATARGALPSDVTKAAFDAGVAIGKGKNLQTAGFAALHDVTPGDDLAEKAENFAQAAIEAKQQGKAVGDVLRDQTVANVEKLGGDAVDTQLRPLLSQMTSNPALVNLSRDALAHAANVPPEVAHAALAATKPLTDKIRLMDANLVKKLLPGPPKVTPAAQTIAANVAQAQQVKDAARAGSPEAKVISSAIDVARMAEDRKRWIGYYEDLERRA